MDISFLIRILIELSVVLIGGLMAYIAAWQLRQDKSIKDIHDDLVEMKACVQDHDRIITRNIPDAWESADKARDMTIESLTRLCLHVLGSTPPKGSPPPPPPPHKKKHPPNA